MTCLPLVVCSDSQAALATLASGAGAQTTALGAADVGCTCSGSPHTGLPGNETADRLAKQASSLPQDDVHLDVRTITRAVGRSASKAWHRSWNDSLFRLSFRSWRIRSWRTGCRVRPKKVEMTR